MFAQNTVGLSLATGIVGTLMLSTSMVSAQSDTGIDGVAVALDADNPVVVQAGEKTYQVQCASCHGAELEGEENWRIRLDNQFLPAPPHNAEGHTWHHADDLLFEITKYGPAEVIGDQDYQSMMPGFKDVLSDDEIIAVLSFIKSTWPEEQREWQDSVNGTQQNGIGTVEEKSLIDQLLK